MGHGDTGTAPHVHDMDMSRAQKIQLYLHEFPRIVDSRCVSGPKLVGKRGGECKLERAQLHVKMMGAWGKIEIKASSNLQDSRVLYLFARLEAIRRKEMKRGKGEKKKAEMVCPLGKEEMEDRGDAVGARCPSRDHDDR
jgi:hypothetical protein